MQWSRSHALWIVVLAAMAGTIWLIWSGHAAVDLRYLTCSTCHM